MLFNNEVTKRRIRKLTQYIPRQDNLVNKIEFIRGLYRYPSRMVGRKLIFNSNEDHTDVLVFAAHSDDDVLGLGTTLYRHRQNGDNIKIIFVTNGSADWDGFRQSWNLKTKESNRRSETRYAEAVQALSLINIAEENIFCLGYPDGGSQRYLKNISEDVLMLLQNLNPHVVYVHCIEGGHIDHDMTSFAVKSTCKKIGYSNVFEWTEYNPKQPLGAKEIKFLPSTHNQFEEVMIDITEKERTLKRKMLSFHKSQNVEQFYLQGEAIRQANVSKLDMELNQHCQLPKYRLNNIVKKFHTSMNNSKTKKLSEVSSENKLFS